MVRGLSEQETFEVRLEWQEGVRYEKIGDKGENLNARTPGSKGPRIAKTILKMKTKLEDSYNLILTYYRVTVIDRIKNPEINFIWLINFNKVV